MSTPMSPPPKIPPAADAPNGRPVTTVATFTTYGAAQRAVDHLADHGFPVERVAIVGTDLRLVESVTGRLTMAKAAGAGALTGAWFGLLIGLLVALFARGGWLGVLVVAVVVGAIWGAIFGAVAHASTRGRRDFTSTSRLEAGQYAVTVWAEHAEPARRLISELAAQR